MRSNIIKFQLPCQFQRFFIPNFVCVLTKERYKKYQTGFSFWRLGHAPGVGLGDTGGPKIFFIQTWLCGISNGSILGPNRRYWGRNRRLCQRPILRFYVTDFVHTLLICDKPVYENVTVKIEVVFLVCNRKTKKR